MTGAPVSSGATLSQLPGAIPQNSSTVDTIGDSVHELPAKLVKEILSGEFMELSKLLPKTFNTLNLPRMSHLPLQ